MTLPVEVRLALSDLVHRYAAYVDARDAEGVAALFTEDAVLVVPEPPRTLEPDVERHGRDGVREALAALAGTVRTVHEVVGEVYDNAGPDRARGSVAGVAHHLLASGDQMTDLLWRLRYADEYERTPDGWRIARRALTIDVVESRPVATIRR